MANIALTEKRFIEILDKKLDEKLDIQTKELKAYTDRQTDLLAGIIGETIAIPLQNLKTRVEETLANRELHQHFTVRSKAKSKYKV